MVIVCPHCQHRLKVGEAKPGRYKPKCSKCQTRFELEISGDAGVEPVVRLPRSAPDVTQPLPEATQASVAPQPTVADQPTVRQQPAATRPPNASQQRTVAQFEATVVSSGEPTASNAFDTQETAATAPTGNEATALEETVTRPPTKIPERLGGYRIVRELGRGAMGAVYLARQISLDRLVALKVIQAQFARNPTFLARFTREAYAAAQLTHHNVVQIYDLGTDDGTNFFSMEYVRGRSLADVSADQGPLDPKTAVGYILQAARGLEFAHNHGMVHRDVKPANLILSEQGVVKVADLGLVKTPDLDSDQLDTSGAADPDASALAAARSNVTLNNTVIGTPHYMAPEQAKSASHVDHRADIYSLGCTFYALLTGRPPFAGNTVMEVITKHRVEPMVRPELVVDKVPPELSDIVMRMVAKSPEDRYANAGQLVADLERFLGRGQEGFKPSEQHVSTLESSVAGFNKSRAARSRGWLATGFLVGCLVAAVGCLPFSLATAAGILTLLLSAVVAYFVTSGARQQSYLFEKVRQFAFQSSWSDRLTAVGALLLAVVIAYVLGWLWMCGVALVLGVMVGLLFHVVVDRRVAAERRAALEPMEALLKKLRIEGVDETRLREFVARFGGEVWEEFFEALFGFEAKLAARQFRQQEGLRSGKRFRAWREPLLNRLEARLRSQRTRKTREHLERVEQEGLKAQGVSADEARAQARRLAATMVAESIAPTRIQPAERGSDPIAAAAAKRARIKAMLAEARGGKEVPQRLLRDSINAWLNCFFGARVRFLLGGCLAVGCVLWMQQNGMLSGTQLREVRELGDLQVDVRGTTPLKLPIVGRFFDGLHVGLAGGLLLASSLFRGWRMSVFLLPAAAIAMFGPQLGLPGIAALGGARTTSVVLAILLGFVGLVFGRSRAE